VIFYYQFVVHIPLWSTGSWHWPSNLYRRWLGLWKSADWGWSSGFASKQNSSPRLDC